MISIYTINGFLIRKTIKLILFVVVIVSIVFLLITTASNTADPHKINNYSNYHCPEIKIYSNQGYMVDDLSKSQKHYIPYQSIPKLLIESLIAVEDRKFFQHKGFNSISIFRALLQNSFHFLQNKKLIGASTITQQVVKGFFLSSERTLNRKIKECILAYRVTKIVSKKQVLEMYLNHTYFGEYSYGIYAASHNYFAKNLKDLNIEEIALLASLPKAPTALNPYKNYDRALQRRNWVINKMYVENYITFLQKEKSSYQPIKLSYYKIKSLNLTNYYSNTIKVELHKILGHKYISEKNLVINSNIDLNHQYNAQQSLRFGLHDYDMTRGWRGPVAHINKKIIDLYSIFRKIMNSHYHGSFYLGLVYQIKDNDLFIISSNGEKKFLKKSAIKWITQNNPIDNIFRKGDIVLINKSNHLVQIPEVDGALIVIENRSGKILALVGGYDIRKSQYNRVIQSYRQPGSAFKPFLYLSAFEKGVSPNSLLMDEPMNVKMDDKLYSYAPKNYNNLYRGLLTLRTSFEKSINITTIRLLLLVGLEKIKEISCRYNIYRPDIISDYSIALGSHETNLLKLTNAYTSIANDGILLSPKIINSIYTTQGKLLYKANNMICSNCNKIARSQSFLPILNIKGKKNTTNYANHQVLSLLEGNVSKKVYTSKIKFIGKTGTTNNSFDTWFIGMTADISVGVYTGYDYPRTLGKSITGSNFALPIFQDFINKLEYSSDREFKVTKETLRHYVDSKTGELIVNKRLL